MGLNKTKTTISKSEVKTASDFTFLFGKKNYLFMAIGLAFIFFGFFLMTGPDANTRPDGVFDRTYWNEGIYSFTRIRLAPLLILIGFVLEIYAILLKPKTI